MTVYCISYLLLVFVLNDISHVTGHGGMVEPPMRSIAWRYGFDAPVNYDWMSLYCGGLNIFQRNGGKCGLCGDPYTGPYENDKGGVYDTGIIVRHYPIGLQEIEVKVELTAHHKGYFRFKLCPNNDNALTTECLDRYPLQIREGRSQGDAYRYFPPENTKLHELHLMLPPEVTCDRCVLQWTYTAGNNAGVGPDGRSCLGCGIQETFVNCADISIGGTLDRVAVPTDNGNITGGGREVILPERNDIVDIIQNSPPENSLDEFINTLQRPSSQQELPPRRLDRDRRPTQPSAMDPWRSDRNSEQTFSNGNSQNSFGTQNGNDNFDFATPSSAIDRSFGHSRRNSFHRDSMASSRHLDFSGISNPSILRALNSHFNRDQMRTLGGHPFHRPHSFHDNVHSPHEALPPSPMGVARRQPFGHTSNGEPMTDNRLISEHDTHTTLLGSLNPILSEVNRQHSENNRRHSEINHRHRDMSPNDNFQQRSHRFSSSVLMGKHHTSDLDTRFPSVPNSRPTSHTAHWQSGTSGGLHSDHTGQHIHHGQRPTHSRLHGQSRSEFRTQHKTASLHPHYRLPRRIIVHSMDLAQHLLRRYPQLKGRVFLSSRAHRLNKYANAVNRYRFRQRW